MPNKTERSGEHELCNAWSPKCKKGTEKWASGIVTHASRVCRELDDLHSGAIRKGALPDSRPEGDAKPQDGDLVSPQIACTARNADLPIHSILSSYMLHLACAWVLQEDALMLP